jgi:hypothetical protein
MVALLLVQLLEHPSWQRVELYGGGRIDSETRSDRRYALCIAEMATVMDRRC